MFCCDALDKEESRRDLESRGGSSEDEIGGEAMAINGGFSSRRWRRIIHLRHGMVVMVMMMAMVMVITHGRL